MIATAPDVKAHEGKGMKKFLAAVILCTSLFAEEPVKPPAPPPGWEATTDKPVEPKAVKTEAKVEQSVDAAKILRAKLLEIGEEERLSKIKSVEKEIAGLKDGQRKDGLTKNLKALKAAKGSFFPTVDAKPNSIGVLGHQVLVYQIVDQANMIIDDPILDRHQLSWITGCGTEGIVDGQRVDIKTILQYAGTKSYKSIDGGISTIWHFNAVITGEDHGGGQP